MFETVGFVWDIIVDGIKGAASSLKLLAYWVAAWFVKVLGFLYTGVFGENSLDFLNVWYWDTTSSIKNKIKFKYTYMKDYMYAKYITNMGIQPEGFDFNSYRRGYRLGLLIGILYGVIGFVVGILLF